MKKVSLKEIAEQLKISKTTISFVLNGKGDEKNISKQTQQKIFDLVEKLNYRPSALAQSLKTGTTMSVAYLVPDIANPFFAKIGRKIEDKLLNKGYQLLIGSTDEQEQKEKNLIRTFQNRQVDGFILASSASDLTEVNYLVSNNVPLVFFDRELNVKAPFVLVENRKAMQSAVSELLKQGFSKTALISLTPDIKPLIERIEGYKEALQSFKQAVDETLIASVSSSELRKEIAQNLEFMLGQGVDSFVFTNNLVANEALWLLNKYYPQQFNKLGFATFDNLDTFDYMVPKIISVAQPVEQIAEKVAEHILLQMCDKNFSNEKILLEPELIKR